MKVLFRAMVVTLAAITASTCGSKTTNVTMLFDGGFLFVEHTDGRLSVVSPRESGTHHEAMLEVTSPGMEKPYPLKNWNIALETGGGGANTIALPQRQPVHQSEQDCTPIPRSTPTANNQSWLPDLSDLHPNQTLDLSPANIESRIQLTHGRLDVAMAYGCWQLQNAAGGKRPQSLVYGDNSVKFVTEAMGSLKLVFTPLPGTTARAFEVPIPLDGIDDVVIEVGYPRIPVTGTPAGMPMADFSRHYRLLPGVAAPDRYLPIAKIDHASGGPGSIPGRECASAKFTEKR